MAELWQWIQDHGVVVATYVYLGLDVLLRLVGLVVVPRNRRPGSALAWLMAIMVLPLVGFPLYLLLGKAELPRKRREKQKVINRLMHVRAQDLPDSELDEDSPSWLQSAVSLNRELGAFPLTGNNSADLEIDYDTSIARMTADIRAATREVHVLFFAMALDEVTQDFFDALAEAADRGVTVRVLYDHWGSLSHGSVYRAMRRHLDAHGIEHYPMMPIKPFRDGAFQRPDLRNHRKLLILDGQIGWMGSQNLIAAHYDKKSNIRRGLHWQETMARFRGPIVSEMNLLFATDWYYESAEMLTEDDLVQAPTDTSGSYECQLVPSGPGFVFENNLALFNQLFYSASRRIIAVSPYFVPEESMLAALVTAARRGVEVELFVSEIGDQFLVFHAQRSYYAALLEAGVRIWLYRAPTILHAKHVTIDDAVTVIGSSNMDIRSFLLDMESSMMIGGTDFMEKMHHVEDVYRSRSRELTLEEWEQRPVPMRLLDNLCRLASAVV
ncbi:cardiolipin synthase [Brachybacterium alimentarium]|uniref:Cardiolipin synthase n=1 Tax=Brachybacterium alimentarium TaxID=47845 RepID=A0A2A3YLC4_9MICO|nr:cardiolipin synthase [Brachybacterium alimentarium]PCC40097.1 cardiolipin synthase [Brachybacterium alimentarium]RCS69428.1 cardiolipin synthase [Brachybacterium alimentarium]RCS71362.1 cardiolipin synthase [Brachybacterium alimentarium]RCS82759.1 cardiolipin synthase [Brachybacterium alimentarium]RCS87403.1 cardiolipin synthase [Brachybacterium alimentarium]